MALGLTTMPYTAKAGAGVTRKKLEPCRQGAVCNRDHRHLLLKYWTKQSASDYIKSLTSLGYGFFVDPKNAGFADEIIAAINTAPTSLIP